MINRPQLAASAALWRFARDHSFWPRPASNGWRRENREVGVTPRQSIEADLAISYRGKLTAQQTWRRAMLGRRPVGVDNADARARLESRD
jgi:hypothetical protein